MKSYSIIVFLAITLLYQVDSIAPVAVPIAVEIAKLVIIPLFGIIMGVVNNEIDKDSIEKHDHDLWLWANELGKQPNVDWVLCCEYWQCAFHNEHYDENVIHDIDASGNEISSIYTADMNSVVYEYGVQKNRTFRCYTGSYKMHLCMTAYGSEDLGGDQMLAHGGNLWEDGKGTKCY